MAGERSCFSLRVPPGFPLAVACIDSGPSELLLAAPAPEQGHVAKGSFSIYKLTEKFSCGAGDEENAGALV